MKERIKITIFCVTFILFMVGMMAFIADKQIYG